MACSPLSSLSRTPRPHGLPPPPFIFLRHTSLSFNSITTSLLRLADISMGFPSVCYTVILPRPVALVVHLLDRIKLAVSMALFHLGLTSSYEDQFLYPLPPLPDFIPASPSFSLPLPASAIKTGLPVVRFSSLRKTGVLLREPVCAFCLGALEARHEVRLLGNCSHAFHRACIDKWVDIGHVTCPLCRAQLLPLPLPNRREEEEEHGVDAD